jgi:hypothetical protein
MFSSTPHGLPLSVAITGTLSPMKQALRFRPPASVNDGGGQLRGTSPLLHRLPAYCEPRTSRR